MARCLKCDKEMVFERFFGKEEYFDGWRCVWCGEIIDPTILENRQEFSHSAIITDFHSKRRWKHDPYL